MITASALICGKGAYLAVIKIMSLGYSDGLSLTAPAVLGGGIVSAAVGHSIARAENEYAAAMESAFEDLVDDVVVLAAAA